VPSSGTSTGTGKPQHIQTSLEQSPQQQASSSSTRAPGAGEPEKYVAGAEVTIGAYRFRCTSVLGKGSFGEVWSGEILGGGHEQRREVALKDVICSSPGDLQQAVLEANILERFQNLAVMTPGQGPSVMRVPRYLAHRVEQQEAGWRVRMAMTRVPGEPLDAFLQRPPPPGQDGPSAIRRGAALATQLLRQLGPTLERIAPHAWHRDVNARNVLLSDAVEGGRLRTCLDVEDTGRRASFWLIDFGLAVDAKTWPMEWAKADVAGDCRYWPPSSFMMSFYGPEQTASTSGFCNQYQTRLDIVGLGLTALEVFCTIALASSYTWGTDGLRGSWRRLFGAWECYREEVSRWHHKIFRVFSTGGDMGSLYEELKKEHVVQKVVAHLEKIRSLLRACTSRTEDGRIQSLLGVLADLIDENSTVGLREAVETLGGDAASLPEPSAGDRACTHIGAATARPCSPSCGGVPRLRWCAPPTGSPEKPQASPQLQPPSPPLQPPPPPLKWQVVRVPHTARSHLAGGA